MNVNKQAINFDGMKRVNVSLAMYDVVRGLPLHTSWRMSNGAVRHCLNVHFDDAVIMLCVDFSGIAVYSLSMYLTDGTICTRSLTDFLNTDAIAAGTTAPEFATILRLAAAVNTGNIVAYVDDLDEANRLTGLNVTQLGQCPGLRVYRQLGLGVDAVFAEPVSVVVDGEPSAVDTLRTLRDVREQLHPETYVETFDDVLAKLGQHELVYVDADYLEVRVNRVRMIFVNVDRPLLVLGAVEHRTALSETIAPFMFNVIQNINNRRAALNALAD